MPEFIGYVTYFRRSPRLIFLTFGLLYLALVWTTPSYAPLYLLLTFTALAFFLSFIAPNGKEWGDQRRLLMHISDTRTPTFEHPAYVRHSRAYMINKRGQVNYTQQWTPAAASARPKGVVVILHGYADHSSGLKHLTAHWLVKEGMHVVGMDYPGHGRSDGLHVHIPSFEPILDDLLQLIAQVKEEYPSLPYFLFSESMGGAIAFLLSTRHEALFAGAIFCSPMCQIAPEMTPPAFTVNFLLLLMRIAPQLPITPTPDVADLTFKRPEIYDQVKHSVVYYARMPRLATAANMLFSSLRIADQLHDLRLPFIILHGEDDKVTDPRMSKRMYDEAASTDKTLKASAHTHTAHSLNLCCLSPLACSASRRSVRRCVCAAVPQGVA